jgi:hypothetical protein
MKYLPVIMVLAFGFAWYKLWVQPRTEFLMEVMDCMEFDSSEESYTYCAERVSESRG